MESDYNENDEDDEILDAWEKFKIIGGEHIDIGRQNSTSKYSSLLFKDIYIETIPKYVYFTLDSIKPMIGCI